MSVATLAQASRLSQLVRHWVKALQRPFGMAQMEGRGDQATDRQRIGQREEHEGHEAGGRRHAQPQPEQQAEAEAREGGEQDDGRRGMHQSGPFGQCGKRAVEPAEKALRLIGDGGEIRRQDIGFLQLVARPRRQVLVGRLGALLGHQVDAAAFG